MGFIDLPSSGLMVNYKMVEQANIRNQIHPPATPGYLMSGMFYTGIRVSRWIRMKLILLTFKQVTLQVNMTS